MDMETKTLLQEMAADDYCKFKFGKQIEKALKAAPTAPQDLAPGLQLIREGLAKIEEATGKKPAVKRPKSDASGQSGGPK